ncbi:asparagine synthase [Microbacterium sp. NE2HP2]|uniref:Asparagine synthase n=1 Tax=Microbacterium plantarum TaxID=1816425 RepID=A0ABV5EQK9_9MICO|nr:MULTISPECIES: asparagine synthase [Microbacterium]MDF2917639.1 asparagine synthase [Microbacterium sp.]MCZ4067555.1 asparagine synthase [Microbacterium sp. H37-C3]MDD7944457.1 asparagine synthase [Microbacterium plantarum]WHE36787.1 asparagine synthase [Microbacterium sp. BDGP8]WRK18032.1 asparagine synthase [Microbacterium plantarum]
MATRQARTKSSEIVAEGLYIASAATRLALKNAILVDILADGRDFEADRFLDDARDALISLAEEAEADAERTHRERKAASGRYSDSSGTHDYRSRDVSNLRRRRKQSLRIAKELRERAADEAELRKLIADAREAAWGEVAGNIDRTLRIEAARPDLEPDYERMRTARMQALRMVDLPRLRSQRRNAQRQAVERDEAVDSAVAPVID